MIIDKQWIPKKFVIVNFHRLPIFIDYPYQSFGGYAMATARCVVHVVDFKFLQFLV